ncbi:MAG: hypothetical protein JXR78_03090 [Victivallales bacterium]|nr:hypothetical protein [Victivallales bacterium]
MKTNVATGRDWFTPIKNEGYIKYNGIYPKRTPPFHCMSNPLPTANHYLNCGWTNYAIGYWIAGARLSKQKISVALFIDAYDPYQNKSNYYTLGGRGTEPWSYVFPVHERSSNIGFSDGSARKLYIGERAISVNANSDLGDIKALWYWPIY